MTLHLSQKGIDFIKSYETLQLTAYDAGEHDGILTIGYGHRDPDLEAGDTITAGDADALLASDLQTFVDAVNGAITAELTQHEFDALVALAFNAGKGIFTSGSPKYDSALVSAVNADDIPLVSYNISGYRKSGGDVLSGLVARRNDEIELFITGNYERDYDYNDRRSTGVYTSVDTTLTAPQALGVVGASSINNMFKLVLESQIGRTLSNVQYTGAANAAYLVSEFNVFGIFNLDRGFFLSTGDFPGPTNTSVNHTVSYGTPGDANLTATAASAFFGAGATQDAAVLQFTVNVKAQSAVNGISFDIVFGSDEYPEFSNTDFVDVAAIYVDGTNVALFNNNPATPLSIIDENVSSNNYVNNTSGSYGIEWDGFSRLLSVRAPLSTGNHVIKIGIADTGDTLYDSGLYVQNIKLLTGGGTGGGVLNVIKGSSNNDNVQPTTIKESIELAGGADTVSGTPQQLDGDIITGFGADDNLTFKGVLFGQENLSVTYGSATLHIDTNGDLSPDTTVTLAGNFEGADFSVGHAGPNSIVTVAFPPPETPPTAGDDAFETVQETALVVAAPGVLAGDSDLEADPLTALLVDPPLHGSVTLNSDGGFTYTPAAGYAGPDSFTYKANDGTADSNVASVDLAVTPLYLTIADQSISEGDAGERTLVFFVNLAAAVDHAVTVAFATGGGTATVGVDYVSTHGVLSIPGGQTSASFAVPVRGDTAVESNETFQITLSNPVGATLGDDFTAIGTILDNDQPQSLVGTAAADSLVGGGGNDTIFGQGGSDTLFGSDGDDTIIGNDGNDTILAGNGNDLVSGDVATGAGNDSIEAGAGNDTVLVADGRDTVIGGDGEDLVGVFAGSPSIVGGAGKDVIVIGSGACTVDGGDGDDLIGVFDGTHSLAAGAGSDVVLLAGGSSTVDGGDGADIIAVFGGNGHRLLGGAGDDVFYGGGTNITLEGGGGTDVFVSGPGAETFAYHSGFGPADYIHGFASGSDRLALAANINGTGIATANDALGHVSVVTLATLGPAAAITLGAEIIYMVGITQLQAADFVIG